MLKEIRPAIVFLVALTLITGLAYPLAMTAIAQVRGFRSRPRQPDRTGRQGRRLGPDRPGVQGRQVFPWPASATSAPDPADSSKTVSAPYNAANSGGSNLGPTNKALIDRVKATSDALKIEPLGAGADRSGHHLRQRPRSRYLAGSPRFSELPRIAKARNLPEDRVRQLVEAIAKAAGLGSWASRA